MLKYVSERSAYGEPRLPKAPDRKDAWVNMNRLKRTAGKFIKKIVDCFTGTGLDQALMKAEGEAACDGRLSEVIRLSAAEGCVLLKNDGTLPLDKNKEISVFGRTQFDWFYVGYGSGGNVNAPYKVNLVDGLENAGASYNKAVAEAYRSWISVPVNAADEGWWGHWPFSHPEMPLDPALVKKAAETSSAAVCVIGRAAGEDRDNKLKKGSYYLTDEELSMLKAVTDTFEKTVVILDVGNIIDMSWTGQFGDRISAILIAWLGGMESGNALCDVLFGAVSPSGKLPDTIAENYSDYASSPFFGGKKYNRYSEDIFVGYRYFDAHPEKVLWRFGYGLSYTTFEVQETDCPEYDAGNGRFSVSVTVKNTGKAAAKEVVRLYCRQAPGRLSKPVRVLAGFAKTKIIAPGESDTVNIIFDRKYISSFDEAIHAFVIERGQYVFELQTDSPSGAGFVPIGTYDCEEEIVVEHCRTLFFSGPELKKRILDELPAGINYAGDNGIVFDDVRAAHEKLDSFISQLSLEELEALTRGHGMMDSPLGTPGNAGVFGGIIPSLREKGIKPVTCADGPAGLRLKRYAALMPCGTALAASWNEELVSEMHRLIAKEMEEYGVDMQLSPGMNIHRNPLCGRNFEYFSEDPVLSGKNGAAVVRGVQSAGRSSCPKHFACNNQETKRNTNDSLVSERALREIYLRNFEITVKEASPLAIMTSYNKVNGVWSHYNYDLVTTVLRGEWGFSGLVITDWWMKKSRSPEFPKLRDNAYRVRAGVDVLMPGNMSRVRRRFVSDGTLLKTVGKSGGITPGEIQQSARRVLELILALDKDK